MQNSKWNFAISLEFWVRSLQDATRVSRSSGSIRRRSQLISLPVGSRKKFDP